MKESVFSISVATLQRTVLTVGKWLLKSIGGMVIILDQIAMASYFNIWVLCNILESTLDCFASPINSAKLQQLT